MRALVLAWSLAAIAAKKKISTREELLAKNEEIIRTRSKVPEKAPTREEWEANTENLVSKHDVDGDGVITYEELKQVLTRTQTKGGPKPRVMAGKIKEQMDRDKDGTVTAEEGRKYFGSMIPGGAAQCPVHTARTRRSNTPRTQAKYSRI